MERRGVTHQQLESLVASQATLAKLRDRIVSSRVQDYFDRHSADFDTAYIARFVLSDETLAVETSERIRRGEVNFLAAAQAAFVAGKPSPRASGDVFSVTQRRDAPAEIRQSLFESTPGSVLAPVRDRDAYAVIQVLSIVPARLDETTRNIVKKVLFEEWLKERRSASTIDWLWGNLGFAQGSGSAK